MTPKDPYRYFRIEARELVDGLGTGVVALEKAPSDATVIARLLRLAHTLKGASRVVKLGAIAEATHAFEETLAPFRDGRGLAAADIDALFVLVDTIRAHVGSVEAVATAAPVASSPPSSSPTAVTRAHAVPPPATARDEIETVRVEIDDVDRLLARVAEATALVTALQRETDGVEGTGKAAGLVDRVSRELGQVRDAANRLRLAPASSIFAALERAVRDAAHATGKEVTFAASGSKVRLDAHVLAAVRDAFLHVVRNAVAHGIEDKAARTAGGKAAVGRVELRVERRGGRVVFACEDDGRGIDHDAVRRAAIERGIASPAAAAAMSADDVVRLLFQGGVTTAATVTEVAGRGVGLDVVRETAARLQGEVVVRSAPGRGTTVELNVPVSLASVTALLVEVGGVVASIPLENIVRTLRLADATIAASPAGETLDDDGRALAFLPLAGALAGSRVAAAPSQRQRRGSVVIVRSGDAHAHAHAGDAAPRAAIGVDRLLGTTNVVVRPLPPGIEVEALVAGAALDAEGNPQLVLDPDALVVAAQAPRVLADHVAPARARPVLVIDDSLTTRMLEQSILESAGYEVEVASSAEEGLGKARDRPYALFVVDVEMPGMNGFEFIAQTRSDPHLRETPAILVTSLNSGEDRRRGSDAGARGYIVKGEFDQGRLLQTIRDLIGAGAA